MWNRSITVSSEKFITGDAFIKGYCLGPNVQGGGKESQIRVRPEGRRNPSQSAGQTQEQARTRNRWFYVSKNAVEQH